MQQHPQQWTSLQATRRKQPEVMSLMGRDTKDSKVAVAFEDAVNSMDEPLACHPLITK
jgi:hypothetical protein